VVRFYESGFARHPLGYEVAFLVTERLTGHTLEPRSEGEARVHGRRGARSDEHLANALEYLERHSVVHRD